MLQFWCGGRHDKSQSVIFFFLSQFFFTLSHFSFSFPFESVSVENHFKTHKDLDPQEFQATPEQTATGKGKSNPLMGVAFPKSQWCVVLKLIRGTQCHWGECMVSLPYKNKTETVTSDKFGAY